MKNSVFWDVAPCRTCANRRFGGTYRLHLQGRKIHARGTSVSRWLQTAFFNGINVWAVRTHFLVIAWLFIVWGGVQAGSTRHVGHWMTYCTCPGWLWWGRNLWNENWQGKPKYSETTCPSATLSTTNPTWPDPCANPGRRGGKRATNRLSYGAALIGWLYISNYPNYGLRGCS
jgi:hypothetical protein